MAKHTWSSPENRTRYIIAVLVVVIINLFLQFGAHIMHWWR